jgi:triosephosphate isomerase (TIM)
MRKRIIAGNWKMNLMPEDAIQLAKAINNIKLDVNEQIAVFPSSIYLVSIKNTVDSSVRVGAQNAYYENSGAFTGEVSLSQLRAIGIDTIIIGHSERRDIFGETHDLLHQKVNAAAALDMTIFFCCGEQLADREQGNHFSVVEKQLADSLFQLDPEQMKNVVIAYEPVWAIGTGVTATSEQAEEMHAHIRSLLSTKYGDAVAQSTSILYGGSCKPSNAGELFSQPNIDGGLIGGAALTYEDFKGIIKAGQLV